jgi:triosephosphate isomerase
MIAGNWKMNCLTSDGVALARQLAGKAIAAAPSCDVLICPPATILDRVVEAVAGSNISVGGQDCHYEPKGAHTGDISAVMLRDVGCSAVILGHSERRVGHGEGDAIIRAKAVAAHTAGLLAIICVGESEAMYEAGRTIEIVAAQIASSVPDLASPDTTLVAYEPVWAIGSGRTPTLPEVAAVHGMIRSLLGTRFGADSAESFRILYGGSMKPSNASDLLALADVDGGLIGGASLNAEDFWSIARSCR